MARIYTLQRLRERHRTSEVAALVLAVLVVAGLPAGILLSRSWGESTATVTLIAGPDGWNPAIIRATVDRSLRLRAVSWDHTHGLTLRAFGIRAELTPGDPRIFVLTPLQPGAFRFYSQIPCGHGRMEGWLLVGRW